MQKIFQKLSSLCLIFFGLVSLAHAHDGHFPTDSIENPSLDYFRADVSFSFETAYIHRGEKLANASFQPNLNLSYEIIGFDVYTSFWTNAPVKSKELEDIEISSGLAYAYGMLVFDLGFTYYNQNHSTFDTQNQLEIYTGILLDTASILNGINLSPKLYYIYNFAQETNIVEASLSYEFLIGEYFKDENLTLPFSATLGYYASDKRNANGKYKSLGNIDASWFYFTLSSDISYAVSQNFKISLGIRYTQRFFESCQNKFFEAQGADKNIYFGTKFSLSF